MSEIINEISQYFGGNVFVLWTALIGFAFILSSLIKYILNTTSKKLRMLAEKTDGIWDDLLVDALEQLRNFVLFTWIVYFIIKTMPSNPQVFKYAHTIVILVTTYQFGLWGLHMLRQWKESFFKKRGHLDASASTTLGFVFTGGQAFFLVTIGLVALSNLGVDIGALIAGLGVGGIAVALAAQNILGDLLGSLSIVLDKPFVVGDFILVGNEAGTVEHIGIKTTRVRSLSGEELVFANKDLLESRIRNYKRMWQRRVVQKFGVVYSTPVEMLEQIPLWIKELAASYAPSLRLDRCHFIQYGNSSLDFEFVFWIESADNNVYLDLQQKLLLDIFKKFSFEKIEFAYPTQTVFVEKLPKNQA